MTLSLCQQQRINYLCNRAWDWAKTFLGPISAKKWVFVDQGPCGLEQGPQSKEMQYFQNILAV
jgi:hypothetical protein